MRTTTPDESDPADSNGQNDLGPKKLSGSVSENHDTAPSPSDPESLAPSSSSGSRREFLKGVSTSLVVLGATAQATSAADSATQDPPVESAEWWENRMKAPDDGKKFGWFVDTRRCFGCHGCEVSCKSENDVPLGNFIRQTFYKDVGEFPKVARLFMPMSCQHCEKAPCINACPNGAIHKGAGGSVVIDYDRCTGNGSCIDECPYGAIYIDPAANQAVKCHNCYHRVENDMEPACANTCPADAIYFGDLNDENSKVSKALADAEQNGIGVSQLRPDKETQPRVWFAGDAPIEIEERIPTEGDSFSPDSYNIYNWKENPSD